MKGEELRRLSVLAAGDDSGIQNLYENVFTSEDNGLALNVFFELTVCPPGAKAVATVQKALQQKDPFAVALIHCAPGREAFGIQTGEEIRKVDPFVNFIILSESLDDIIKEIIFRIPPTSKLLYLQQPFQKKEIFQLAAALGSMWLSEKELQRVNSEMLDVNSQLMETNDALTVLARNIESTRKESENRIIQRTRTLIIPIIQKLQRERALRQFRPELNLLIGYLENLTSDLAGDLKMAAMLTNTELQIASFIKNGMSSEQIARQLNISVFTVKTHRKNIRRKLDLRHSGVNLRTYLGSGLRG
jgi:DNA-binding CsgD family transcriptional regulator